MIAARFPGVGIQTADLCNFHGRPYPFTEVDLATPEGRVRLRSLRADVLTCIGSLEHLDESVVEDAVLALTEPARWIVMTIGLHSDIRHGIQLHKTRKTPELWSTLLDKYMVMDTFDVTDGGNLLFVLAESRKGPDELDVR